MEDMSHAAYMMSQMELKPHVWYHIDCAVKLTPEQQVDLFTPGGVRRCGYFRTRGEPEAGQRIGFHSKRWNNGEPNTHTVTNVLTTHPTHFMIVEGPDGERALPRECYDGVIARIEQAAIAEHEQALAEKRQAARDRRDKKPLRAQS